MKAGKLNWDDLTKIIENNRGVVREEVRVHSGIGEDCSIINFGEYDCVLSTDPITAASANMGKIAVNINCNDLASSGVEPLGIMVTILAPEGTTIEEIALVMQEIGEEAKKVNIEILGGHTEVTTAVNRIIVSCTVIGRGRANSAVATAGAKVGDDIIVTKYLALEGSSIIVNDMEDRLKNILTTEEIIEAKTYVEYISVIKEGKLSGDFGVNSMHDITEGGVLGALWEVAKGAELGFKVHYDKMPIKNITKKICDLLKIDPLRLISSGSMLITGKNGEELVEILKNNGINAVIIGKITESRGILVVEDKEVEVQPPERDELFKL